MSGLYLNYCFCKITQDMEDVFATEFVDNSLRKFREDYPDYCFYRDGNQILYWSVNPAITTAITKLKSIKLQISSSTHPAVISKMIERKIYQQLCLAGGYNLYYEKYSHNLVAKKAKPLFSDDALDINECAKISTYFFKQNDDFFFGFSVSCNLSYTFKWSKKQFSENKIDASDLFENRAGKVAANKRAIERYKNAKGLQTQIDNLVSTFETKSNHFQFTKRVVEWLKEKLKGELYKNIKITSCEINYLPYSNVFENEIFVAPKKYYANDKTYAGLPSDALKALGPYKAQFSNPNMRVALIGLKENEGTLNVFTKQLAEKIKQLFKLDITYTNYWVEKDTIDSFAKAIAPINLQNTDLAIFVVRKDQKFLRPKESPYLFCKAKLIGQEIPTQCLCIETIKKPNDFILSNISLNIYAKFGGTAWGIEKKDTTKKELIIGIGSTVNYEKQTVISIANVFDNSGIYLAGTCNPIIDRKSYIAELETLLKELFKTILQDETDVHLIFHIFKSAGKDTEIKALENVIKHYDKINISYAFVHLGYGHNFRIYFNDGKLDLKKGQYIKLNKSESLLIVNPHSTTPIKITIDKRSTFKDIYYISQQAFAFAHLSERSFMPSKKPVTILYPSIMTNLIEKLKLIDNWDYNKLKVKGVTEKLWFL